MRNAPYTTGEQGAARYRYSVAIATVLVAAAVRLAFLNALGTRVPFVTFYPAVMLAALYGGLRPGLLAALLSALVASYLWLDPRGFAIADSGDWLAVTVFLLSCAMISAITEAMHRARARAVSAEGEVRFAEERQRAAEALSESERRCKALSEATFEGIAVTEEGRYIDANEQLLSMLGYAREEFIGREVLQDLLPEDRERVLSNIRSGRESHIEHPFLRKDGTQIIVEAHGRTVDYQNRRVRFTALRDITERKRAEAALRISEARFNQLAEQCDAYTWEVDAQGLYTHVSAMSEPILGYRPDELIGQKRFYDLHPESGREEFRDAALAAFARKETFQNLDNPIETADGRQVWVSTSGIPLLNADGTLRGYWGTDTDITERKRAEGELRQNQELLRTVIEGTSDAVYVKDTIGRYLLFNNAAERFTGKRAEEVLGKDDTFLFPLEEARMVMEADQAVMAAGKTKTFEERLTDPTGKALTFLSTKGPMFDDAGTPIGLFGIARDVTDVKRAQEALRRSEDRWYTALDHLGEGVLIATEEGEIFYWNPAALEMHGSASVEEARSPVKDLLRTFQLWTADGARLLPLEDWPMPRIVRGESVRNLELRLRRPDLGWERVILHSGSMVDTATGERLLCLSLFDLTEQRKAEAELLRTVEKLARSNKDLEHFAYVASHDLQEPLRTIKAYTQMLAKRYKGRLDSDADEFIDFVVDGAGRMQTLILDLLAYSRVSSAPNALVPTGSECPLAEALEALRATLKDTGATVTNDPLPTVVADGKQLSQLFQNLIANGVKFRREGVPPAVHISAREEEKEFVFSVRDNGIGIDPKYNRKVFEIFQRLHGQSQYTGTGIGLAICKRITERHGGRIWLESTPGEGTTFYFSLPK